MMHMEKCDVMSCNNQQKCGATVIQYYCPTKCQLAETHQMIFQILFRIFPQCEGKLTWAVVIWTRGRWLKDFLARCFIYYHIKRIISTEKINKTRLEGCGELICSDVKYIQFVYFSTCLLKAHFHLGYEVLSFLIEMHGLTSERVIALGRNVVLAGKCNPLNSFNLWRELALLFWCAHNNAQKDCPRSHSIRPIDFWGSQVNLCAKSGRCGQWALWEIITLAIHCEWPHLVYVNLRAQIQFLQLCRFLLCQHIRSSDHF